MKKQLIFIIPLLSLCYQIAFAQNLDSLKTSKMGASQEYIFEDGSTRSYYKPKFFGIITRVPKDFIGTNKDFVAKDHAWYLGGALASTLLLIPADQYISDKSRAFANNIGLSEDNLYVGNTAIPRNVGAGFYLLGNGTTVILLSTGFAAYGFTTGDYRAKATATGLMESLILSGVFSQSLKRMTGRESPFIAIQNGHNGGNWTPFPSFSKYTKDTPNYDAMPSGHLTTIMAALTVITTNYPDYKWIKPVGYTLISALSLQMMQSRVHWSSDYPIALFMGYFIGKTIARNSFTETKNAGKRYGILKKQKYSTHFFGNRINGYNTLGVNIHL